VFYSIHVRRKTGEWQTELVIRHGNPPKVGDVIDANLHGQTIEARVTNVTTSPSKAKGEPAFFDVYAEEI
jgi:carbamate kinase